MQAEYTKKIPPTYWDPVLLNYPVRKLPETGISSETIGRRWRGQAEIIKRVNEPVEELKEYLFDYNVTKKLTRSQTTEDYGFKLPETNRFNKHTSCSENYYIYPPSRRIADRPPQCSAHVKTEMQSKYTPPIRPSRLVTDKDQFKHPASLPLDTQNEGVNSLVCTHCWVGTTGLMSSNCGSQTCRFPQVVCPSPKRVQGYCIPKEPIWHKELEPLDTTHDGYEKYLDPYLTTSRLNHRPYTAEQLGKLSCSKDIVTYYTIADIPWVRTPKPNIENWRLPLSRHKAMYDREMFKQDFREIRTHNKPQWVPRAFRTEIRDNYVSQTSQPESKVHNYEEEVRSFYESSIANLPTNKQQEHSTVQGKYRTENMLYGSKKPLCSVIDPYVAANKRLIKKP